MLRIDTKGFEALGEMLAHLREDLPKATAMTLTFMGQAAKKAAEDAIREKFHNPTPWIQKSIHLKTAQVADVDMSAIVSIKYESINALAHHIDGGKRRAKGVEKLLRTAGVLKGSHQYIVPGRGMKLDTFGNMPKGEVMKILSALKAQFDPINNSGRNVAAWKRNKDQSRYFVVNGLKSIVTRKRLHPGVYYRGGDGAQTYIKPMLIFVKSPMYRSRWDFFQFTEDAAADAMEAGVDNAIDRLRARGRWWL